MQYPKEIMKVKVVGGPTEKPKHNVASSSSCSAPKLSFVQS